MGVISSIVLGLVWASTEEVTAPELVMSYADYDSTTTMIQDTYLENSDFYTVARYAYNYYVQQIE